MPVELTLWERDRVLLADGDLFAAQGLSRVAVGDILEPEEDGLSLNPLGLNGMRDALDQHDVAAFEPLLREIGDDAALQLAADAVWRQHLGDDQQAVLFRRRRGRRGYLFGLQRP